MTRIVSRPLLAWADDVDGSVRRTNANSATTTTSVVTTPKTIVEPTSITHQSVSMSWAGPECGASGDWLEPQPARTTAGPARKTPRTTPERPVTARLYPIVLRLTR